MRAGSLVAWQADRATVCRSGSSARHTDSPNLRVKQHPDRFVSGWQVVALQPYGGAWLNSWLDRDLGISGRLSVRTGDRHRPPAGPHRRADPAGAAAGHPPGRGPQGGVAGPAAARQRGLGRRQRRPGRSSATSPSGRGSTSIDVLGADLMTHDLTPSTLVGAGPRAGQRAAAGQPGHLLRRPGGVSGRRARRATCRCWRCSTTRRSVRSPTTARSPSCC